MYDARQPAILLRLFCHALVIFVLFNVTFWISSALAPNALWVPKQFFGIDFVKDNHQKIRGAVTYFENQPNSSENELVVILGLSSASEGIASEQLLNTSSKGYKILSLSGGGRNFKEISLFASPLIHSDLAPKLVIFAINPFHFIDPDKKQLDFWQTLRLTPADEILTGWLKKQRKEDLRHLLDMALLDIRGHLFLYFKNNSDDSKLSPWKNSIPMAITPISSLGAWQQKLSQYGARGYYQLTNYTRSNQQVTELSRMVTAFRKKGATVIIVFMPEHSLLYQSVPKKSIPTILDKIEFLLKDQRKVEVVNCREVIPDKYFNDISHMNKKGKERFSEIFDQLLISKLID